MRYEESVGGIVFKKKPLEFLLLNYFAGHWGFVKGHREKGESLHQTLLRELKEETGLEGKIYNDFKAEHTYFFKSRNEIVKKKVTYFIVEVFSKKVVLSKEHKDYVWLPYDKALAKLTFASTKEILQNAKGFFENV